MIKIWFFRIMWFILFPLLMIIGGGLIILFYSLIVLLPAWFSILTGSVDEFFPIDKKKKESKVSNIGLN